MEIDEIESGLIRLDNEYVRLGNLNLSTSKLDVEMQELYDNIELNQFDMLCCRAYEVLESYGFNDDMRCVPYHEGWN